MTLTTNGVKDNHNDGLVLGDPRGGGGHVYMLEGVSKDKDGNVMVTVRNPWGTNKAPDEGVDSADPTVTVNLKQIVDSGHLNRIDIGTTTQQPDQNKSKDSPANPYNVRESPPSPEMSSGCPHVDRLMATVNDPQAFGQAIQAVGASPHGDAFRAEGRAMNMEQQNQQLQQQLTQQQAQPQPQVQQGPVRSL